MPDYFNDSPIEAVEFDRYGITPFAEMLAKSILNIKAPIGTTIALHGPWGSGKSSAVNLVRAKLKNVNDGNLVITDFKCWWYRGEEALALSFLQNLHAVLQDGLGDKVKGLIPNMARQLLQAGPVIGQAVSLASGQPWAAVIPGASKFLSTFFPKGETVEKTFRKLSKILESEDRRFLVIIDDIDRLSPDEALAIFRLVKSVGRLPNVIYLLVFDRALADKAVQDRYPSEGPHFLEKIIQAGFELPAPLQTDLNEAILTSVQEICGSPNQAKIGWIMNNFYDAVVPYITTPRHVARFQNAISVTWPAISGEIAIADFIVLETLRLYEPELFRTIRVLKQRLCGTRKNGDLDGRNEARFALFLTDIPESRHTTVKLALQRLFPRLESMGYGDDSVREWNLEHRVCVERHFETYFRLALSNEALSSGKIEELVARADDRDFIRATFRQAALTKRKSGTSMVSVYLDELTSHATEVEKEKVEPLLCSLFLIHDEIDLEKDADRGFMAIATTSLRFHWLIRRLTRDRFSIDERTNIYVSAIEHAALGWMVDFVRSARSHYRQRDGEPRREEDCLVSQQSIEPLTTCALDAIRAAAADGSLLLHVSLLSILYAWREFSGNNPAEVRVWTDRLLEDDSSVAILARRMTSQSWSLGLGGSDGLGDRISTPSTIAVVSNNIDILDAREFRNRLEHIRDEATIDEASLEAVRTFLDAWDRGLRDRSS